MVVILVDIFGLMPVVVVKDSGTDGTVLVLSMEVIGLLVLLAMTTIVSLVQYMTPMKMLTFSMTHFGMGKDVLIVAVIMVPSHGSIFR